MAKTRTARIGVANTLGNRDNTTAKDELLKNGFAEVDGDITRAVKRPSLVSRYTVTTGQAGATIGQLLFAFQGPAAPGISGTSTLIAIRGDAITRPVT